jgi:hypothetical protein
MYEQMHIKLSKMGKHILSLNITSENYTFCNNFIIISHIYGSRISNNILANIYITNNNNSLTQMTVL